MFEIEKNIPLKQITARASYPFAQMEIGDSFFAEGITVNRLTAAAALHKKAHGRSFSVRKVEGGYRVWRVA